MTFTPDAHTPYQWVDAPRTDTPLDSAHLEAAENDIITYAQGQDEKVVNYFEGGSSSKVPYVNVNGQTLASAGAVTIDASKGNVQAITLQANATSSSITNPTTGQVMTIEWIQDGTGTRTYAWPANCKFAGGAAPTASTTANYTDSVTFRFDGTNWKEISRAVAIH